MRKLWEVLRWTPYVLIVDSKALWYLLNNCAQQRLCVILPLVGGLAMKQWVDVYVWSSFVERVLTCFRLPSLSSTASRPSRLSMTRLITSIHQLTSLAHKIVGKTITTFTPPFMGMWKTTVQSSASPFSTKTAKPRPSILHLVGVLSFDWASGIFLTTPASI